MPIKKLVAFLLIASFLILSAAFVYAGWTVVDECTNSLGDEYKIKRDGNNWGVRKNSNEWLIKDVPRAKAQSFYRSYCNK